MKDISLHILDIIQNSITAGATDIEISIDQNDINDTLVIKIIDNGKGMSPEMVELVADPYTTTRTTRKVGLGLPLLKLNAERTGGHLAIYSKVGQGTKVVSGFRTSHIDCLPIGDMAGVMAITVSGNPQINFCYTHKINGKSYIFDTQEIKAILGDISINTPSVTSFLKEMLKENLDEIKIETIGY
jgi:hypothetical protein